MGLIQWYAKSKLGKGIANYRYNRRMKTAYKILQKSAPYYLKQIGVDKNGTVRQVKDLKFCMRKKRFEVKTIKLLRGMKTNDHGSKSK
jgi:hypothetical protein